MGTYTFGWNYQARRDGQILGPYREGDVVELDDELAGWINRDSPGILDQPQPEPEDQEPERQAKPKPNRQAKAPQNRAG